MIVPAIGALSNSQVLSTSNVDLINQMRSMSVAAGGRVNSLSGNSIQSSSFKEILDGVANAQNKSTDLSRRFIEGDKSVSMADVLSASQDSSIKFEALRVSRNKMLEITKEILNTQI